MNINSFGGFFNECILFFEARNYYIREKIIMEIGFYFVFSVYIIYFKTYSYTVPLKRTIWAF